MKEKLITSQAKRNFFPAIIFGYSLVENAWVDYYKKIIQYEQEMKI